ncbi:MAG TPA: hypothetical protein VNT22_00905, partial [Baekduia sp.]|nr:hypothetical protein [Baekduia sp.]
MTDADRILTTHVGSLPRPPALLELNRRRMEDERFDPGQLDDTLRTEVKRVVDKQTATGIDLCNDGEFGHAMAVVNDYSSWWSYMFTRLDGFGEERHAGLTAPVAPSSFNVQVVPDSARRDAERFPAVYEEVRAAKSEKASAATVPVVERAISYVGQDQVARDVANLKAALGSDRSEDGFICAVGPGSLSMAGNTYYKTHEEFVWACADVMAHEYRAITDAGLTVQIDEPSFAESWDAINPEPSLEDFREYTMLRVEALNHALKGIPREQVRFHCCWGSWHGPHSTDIELKHIVDMLLKIDANLISFE